jgi:hypothetical protein
MEAGIFETNKPETIEPLDSKVNGICDFSLT